MRHAEANGWAIGGSFHSHPRGRAVPSPVDVAAALDPTWWYVVAGPASRPEVRAYRIVDGMVAERLGRRRTGVGRGRTRRRRPMSFTLDVLGSCGSGPSRTAPASGYLVRSDTTAIWVDAGTGTFHQLARRIEPADVAATVISHLHADHCSDLFGWFHYLAYRLQLDHAIPVLLPPGGRSGSRPSSGQSGPTDPLHTVLDLSDVLDGEKFEVGDITLRFAYADHSVPDDRLPFRARRQGPGVLGRHRPGGRLPRPRRRGRRGAVRGGPRRAPGDRHLPVPPVCRPRQVRSLPPPGRARWC